MDKNKEFEEILKNLAHTNDELARDKELLSLQTNKYKREVIKDLKTGTGEAIKHSLKIKEKKPSLLDKIYKMFF